MQTSKIASPKWPWVIGVIAAASVILVCVVWWPLMLWKYPSIDAIGNLSETYAVLGTMFSGLAFIGVIVTVLLQSEELKLQRQELDDTQAIMQSQKAEMELQNKTLREQMETSTFFQLLARQSEIANSQSITRTNTPYSGEAVYVTLCGEFIVGFQNRSKEGSEVEHARTVFNSIENDLLQVLTPYMTNLEVLLTFVERIGKDKNHLFAELIAIQITPPQQLLIAYLGLKGNRFRSTFKLIEKFKTLRKLDYKSLLHDSHTGYIAQYIS